MEKLARLTNQTISGTSAKLSSTSESQLSARSEIVNICALLVQRMRNARGLPAMSLSESRLSASELAGILSDVPLEMIETVYQTAMKNYTEVSQPFGAPQLRAAWLSIKAELLADRAGDQTAAIVGEIAAVTACHHDYVFIGRIADDPPALLGMYECRVCLRCKPVFNLAERRNLTLPQLEESCQ